MNSARLTLAFLISPLIAPIAALVTFSFDLARIPTSRVVLGAFVQYGALAYVVALVFGLPMFLWLRSSRWRGKWAASLSGATIGLLIAVVLFALVPGWTGKDLVVGYSLYAGVGAVCGLVFWLISFGVTSD